MTIAILFRTCSLSAGVIIADFKICMIWHLIINEELARNDILSPCVVWIWPAISILIFQCVGFLSCIGVDERNLLVLGPISCYININIRDCWLFSPPLKATEDGDRKDHLLLQRGKKKTNCFFCYNI